MASPSLNILGMNTVQEGPITVLQLSVQILPSNDLETITEKNSFNLSIGPPGLTCGDSDKFTSITYDIQGLTGQEPIYGPTDPHGTSSAPIGYAFGNNIVPINITLPPGPHTLKIDYVSLSSGHGACIVTNIGTTENFIVIAGSGDRSGLSISYDVIFWIVVILVILTVFGPQLRSFRL